MFRLKVKHKLLIIWLGSIVVALSVMMGLFNHQVGRLHEQSAHDAIAEGFTILANALDNLTTRTRDSAQALIGNEAIIASMNLISRYQDPQNYQPAIFDPEKRRLATDLQQHAIATGMDVLALSDGQGRLAAFYISTEAGGQGAGYVVFENGKPYSVYLAEAREPVAGIPAWAIALWPTGNSDSILWRTDDEVVELLVGPEGRLVLNDTDTIIRQRTTGTSETVGHLNTARLLGTSFMDDVKRQTGLEFQYATPSGSPMPLLPGVAAKGIFASDVPSLALPPRTDNALDIAYASADTDRHFVGAMQMPVRGAPMVTFIFAHASGDLENTLTAFQDSVLVVLALSALIIVPVGIYFLNRAISQPVGQLMECATSIREGGHQDIPIPAGDDEFTELARAFQDMSTAVQSRETALKNSQASLKKAQRIAKIGNWELDFQTERIACSEMAHAILGTVPGDMEGYLGLFMERIHPSDRPIVSRRIERTRDTGESLAVECRVVRPDNEERFVVLQGELNGRGAGGPKLIATVQDITERHMLEKAKSELISTVSHELRTPLTSITGTLGLATGGVLGELPDKLRSMLTTANTNAKRLGALIDDLLDMEKIASGTMAMHMKPVHVPALLEQAREANQAYATTFDATIIIDGAVPDVDVLADEKRLGQVMSNLLSNAAKFSPEGGEIRICANHANGQVAISVTDQGPGIPEDFEPHMFERFAQADQSLTRADQKGGTGLGLSITKSIIELHDGHIAFTTTRAPAPDHGTTFTFTLPEYKEPPQA